MKSNILTIVKKELSRFFTDKRLIFGTVLLPGVMIFVMYSFMGEAMTSLFQSNDKPDAVSVVSMPESMTAVFHAAEIEYKEVPASDIETIKGQIAEKETNFLIIFPENFDADVAAYDISSGKPAPNISFFYNSSDTNSSNLQTQILGIFDAYEATLSNRFDINAGGQNADLASEKDLSGMIYSILMPLLLIILLFSACIAIAPESIVGEKERGTLSTLLVTPLRRSELAIGKILALSIVALLSAVSSTLGTLLSLPKLMGGAVDSGGIFYTAGDYFFLAIIILSTALLFISLVSVISAFAKTMKEAETFTSPLMIVITLVGVSGMLGSSPKNPAFYLIPIYNSVQSMSSIFSYDITPLNILVCVASNLVYTLIFVFILTKMFNSEKVMFSN
ncbi:ABC transporter permease [Scatolibacter rhodanostii]|uniref:ABC transporter permease n=1 Tax=Scatolibacter rhodanostii TaxID=2014781 RepID=UPI000C06D7F2|nr:ABC transporter permease [Scatolibacter rhodanostii]